VVGVRVIAGANPNAISFVIQVGRGGRLTTRDARYMPGIHVAIAAATLGRGTAKAESDPPAAGAISMGALSSEFEKRAMIPPPAKFSPVKPRFVPS